MGELTIIIDNFSHKELKSYLMSLNGILDVVIKNEKLLEIYIKYNPKLIKIKTIKMEILLFLQILNVPSIVAFDKHSIVKTSLYVITRDHICCEYCLKGAIGSLLEIEGIEKVKSNFFEEDQYENDIIINIEYNSDILSDNDLKQIELKLDI